MTEKALIEIQDSINGQKLLYEHYYHKMYEVSIRYLTVKEDAEDALVEAFVRVFRGFESFEYRGEGCLSKWIKTIVINEALRKINIRKKLWIQDGMMEEDVEIKEDIEGNIDLEFLLSLVQSLPDGYRIVFQMFVVEGYSHNEIAEMLKVSVSTSKSQLYKARLCLIKKLKTIERYEIARN